MPLYRKTRKYAEKAPNNLKHPNERVHARGEHIHLVKFERLRHDLHSPAYLPTRRALDEYQGLGNAEPTQPSDVVIVRVELVFIFFEGR